MAIGRKTGGRQKGTPNKATADIKEAIRTAFHEAGGVDYLIKIAKTDAKTFCALLGKVVPADINANLTHNVNLPDFLADYWRRRTDRQVG